MQEIHSIGGGRFFGCAADRRLRPHHHQNQHQPLKCPRCDSLNTKFCYYNNYNLSQPRHFCKNCRRYWTKGGVLRNVPVGGGFRKSRRSNKPKTTNTNNNNNGSSSSETAPAEVLSAPPPAPPPQPPEPERNSASHSSSESSSLTVAAATEAMSAPTSNAASNNNIDVRESKFLASASTSGVFSEIGNFTSLIASNNEPLGFQFGSNNNNNDNNNSVLDPTSFRFGFSHEQMQVAQGGGNDQWQQQNHHGFGTASFLDHSVPLEFSSSVQHNKAGGFGSLDWQSGATQGLFDLPNTVDQPYWTHTHWSDQDNPNLFHLP